MTNMQCGGTSKSYYLNDLDVKKFVGWLSQNFSNDTFAHRYFNRRKKCRWSCSSLSDAYKHYDWPITLTDLVKAHSSVKEGSDFATNANVLAALQHLLITALNADDLPGVTVAALEVMTWGGVRAGNVSWLLNSANQRVLLHTLQSTRTALNAGDTTVPVLTNKSLRFNAGMTKVYSLICDDFIIYDSRVGAAIGWMVRKYCEAEGLTCVPDTLRFPWAPAKEATGQSKPKQRDPSSPTLKFPRLKSGPFHALWNLRASWLLEAVLQHPTIVTNNGLKEVPANLQMRALEAALFMIGYDLGYDESSLSSASIGYSPMQNWIECFTKTRRVKFRYQLHSDQITTQSWTKEGGWSRGPTFTAELIDSTLSELRKLFPFNQDFPLANSATGVQMGSAEPGLGTAYFQASHRKRNPPDTSRLAAILEEIGILTPAVQENCYGKRWLIAEGVISVKEALRKNIEIYEDL